MGGMEVLTSVKIFLTPLASITPPHPLLFVFRPKAVLSLKSIKRTVIRFMNS